MDTETSAPPTSHYEYVMPQQHQNTQLKRQSFAYMSQLEGWCSEDKAGILIDLIVKYKPQVVVEIGVWGGKSLVPMANALRANGSGKIYGIDPWSNQESIKELISDANLEFWNRADHSAILDKLNRWIHRYGLKEQISLLRCTSEQAPLIYTIDMLHIDGNHSEKTSFFDVNKWVPLVKSGGFIIFDDINWRENGTATTGKAVQWLDEHCIKVGEFTDSCVWGIWVKP